MGRRPATKTGESAAHEGFAHGGRSRPAGDFDGRLGMLLHRKKTSLLVFGREEKLCAGPGGPFFAEEEDYFISSRIFSLGSRPTVRRTSWPSRKDTTVGMDITW